MVHLVETLLGKGYELKVYDPNICLDRLVGANRQFIEATIPHISRLLCESPEEVIEGSEVLVIGHRTPALEKLLGSANGHHTIVDLAGVRAKLPPMNGRYHGIAW